ncbi:MAG: isoprenylcysteine carboxylmethyltransferase family protein [Vicinamibacterales bacterium]|nr:isoprenylcysteine carboxylmethyltransferase family protein [Vicinamibacterales bacterium]
MTGAPRSGPIAEQLTAMGDTLFRWRSYAPLLLLPLFLLTLLDDRHPTPFAWEVACFLISLSGLVLRAYVVGTAPDGASTRGTGQPTAGSLSTLGAYSVVRHPLYLGNTLVALGCALLSGTWYLAVIVILLSFIYHERIAAREELFLRQTFDDRFLAWAREVPAMIPAFANYRPSGVPFQVRKVIVQESHGLCAIGTAFLVLDTLEDSIRLRAFTVDVRWLGLFAATLVPFLYVVATKRMARQVAGT